MHYLGLALYAEGPTDYYFLRPLLLRLCEDICVSESVHSVEFSEVLELDEPDDLKDAPREQRILAAARLARGAWRIVFVHSDGEGQPAMVRSQRTQPALNLLKHELGVEGESVAVIPIRETEAWAIQDGDALRQVFGTTLSDAELGLPGMPAAVESTLDPKKTLHSVFLATRPSGRRRRQGVSPMLNALGEQVSLKRLRLLSGFAALEAELKSALQKLNIL